MMQGLESNRGFAMRVCELCVRVCECDNMVVVASFHFQQKSVSTVRVSLNVLVNYRALEWV